MLKTHALPDVLRGSMARTRRKLICAWWALVCQAIQFYSSQPQIGVIQVLVSGIIAASQHGERSQQQFNLACTSSKNSSGQKQRACAPLLSGDNVKSGRYFVGSDFLAVLAQHGAGRAAIRHFAERIEFTPQHAGLCAG